MFYIIKYWYLLLIYDGNNDVWPVFEEPDGDHGECEEEGVEQQGEAVQLVQLQRKYLLLAAKIFTA